MTLPVINTAQSVTFPPSLAHIWGDPAGCSAYLHVLKAYPKRETFESEEGTQAHRLASDAMRRWFSGGRFCFCDPTEDTPPEMVGFVNNYLSAAAQEYSDADGASRSGAEEKLILRNIHPSKSTGYIDWWWWSEAVVSVWDFKYGYGVVEPQRNRQLVGYASALLRMRGIQPGCDEVSHNVEVRLHIYQPRAPHHRGPHRTWVATPAEIFEIEAEMSQRAAEIDTGKIEFRSGNHCRYCPAFLDCPTARESVAEAISYCGQPVLERYTPEQLGNEVKLLERVADIITNRHKAAKTELQKRLENGERCARWTLGEKKSNMFWIDDGPKMLQAMGFDVHKDPAPRTPKQAIDSGIPEDLVLKYAKRTTSPVLVEERGQTAELIKELSK